MTRRKDLLFDTVSTPGIHFNYSVSSFDVAPTCTFLTFFFFASSSDGVQVFVMGVVSFVSMLRCIFTDLRRAQGMVLLDS